MVDPAQRLIWSHRLLFLVLATVLLFFRLLPLGPSASSWLFAWLPLDSERAASWPGPDLLLCLILAWVMRRPGYLPVLLIVLVVFVEDLILMRPPGLWTALVVLASEFIRSRVALTRELNFAIEWALVAGLMLSMLLVYRLIFAIAFIPQPAFGFALLQVLWSILCYPLVVMASRYALDLHKPAAGEVDAMGRRM